MHTYIDTYTVLGISTTQHVLTLFPTTLLFNCSEQNESLQPAWYHHLQFHNSSLSPSSKYVCVSSTVSSKQKIWDLINNEFPFLNLTYQLFIRQQRHLLMIISCFFRKLCLSGLFYINRQMTSTVSPVSVTQKEKWLPLTKKPIDFHLLHHIYSWVC